jgi:hypothetical protein
VPRIVRGGDETTTNDDLRRTGSRGVAKSDYTAILIFVDLVEKKCSGEVKLDGSGVPEVSIDSPDQPSGR